MRPQEIMDIDELFWKIHDGTDKQLVHLKALHGCYWRTCSCINCQISLLPLGFSPLFFSILTFTLVIRHLPVFPLYLNVAPKCERRKGAQGLTVRPLGSS